MISNIINALERKGIELKPGLTEEEVEEIQSLYHITFTTKLKDFLMCVLPVANGFYNWRDFSPENVSHIKQILNQPFEGVLNYANEVEWCEQWGEVPEDPEEIAIEVKWRLRDAPKLIPIYGHRYVPMVDMSDPPVLSVYGTDVIVYGYNLEDYFKREFLRIKDAENDMETNIHQVPFWSEIM